MISEKASTALGTVGTVCWCIQLIPQIYFNFKRKNCEGFPPIFMFLWALCGIPFSIYFVSTRANLAVQIQPQLFLLFCLTAFIQSLYYPPVQMSKKKIVVILLTFIICGVGAEVGFILWLRKLYDEGTKWPTLIFGISASVILALGLVPPYFELARRNGRVVGINFLFLLVDFSGAFFSMLAVVFGNMDVMGIILYCICMTMEAGIFLSQIIWWLRFRAFNKDADLEKNDERQTSIGNQDTESKYIVLNGDIDCENPQKNEEKVVGEVPK
ncbi:hypothetical protein WICMUC_003559 [Wickerhamomyces mucosus]|uniref:PQ-loop-domain-containing protein n=1 Tax=Wickerhamomyces mucosus TaxID=1378264 RepID=A0A9P8TCW0_9ASCO|nr:hypothetical protein WICMUC_003559 [Wickerhamomyces mucosus]